MKLLVISILLLHFTDFISGQGEECVTADRARGVCQLLPNCPSLIQLYSTNRGNPLIINYLITSQRNCGNRNFNRNPIVCCASNEQPVQTTTPPPTTQSPTPPTTQKNPTADSSCRDPAGNTGVCVNIKECPPVLNDFLSKQNDPNYVRYIQQSNANCNYIQPHICCPQSAPVTTPPPQPPTDTPVEPSGPAHLMSPGEGCGFSNKTHNRVVGGVDAELGAWPWMALLGYKNSLGEIGFKCGGSIITQKHVLSAAHCVISSLQVVRVGEHNLDSNTETQHIDIPVAKATAHPEYDKKDGHSDISIILLQQTIPFSLNIHAICIPTQPPVLTRNFEGYSPFVAGWGRTQEGGKSATVLQELQLPVLKNSECMERYRDVRKLISDKQFDDGVLCAGFLEGGKDSCQGDSGGPLMIPIRSDGVFLYYQIGVVSYGIGCARANIPGVYTRVQTYSQWIQDQVANNIKECPLVRYDFLARRNDPNYIRYIQQSNANCNYVQPFICCPQTASDVSTTPPVVTQPPTTPSPVQPSGQTGGPAHLLTPEEGCGFSNASHNRVVGGVDANLGAWPWMALLGYKNSLGEIGFKCGGSIITQKHVLSAAHCIRPGLDQVRVGEHNLNTDSETQHLDIPIAKSTPHPEYDKKDGHSDIAVISLTRSIPFSLRINAVCIPTQPPILTRNFEGFKPFVAGWGRTQEGGKSAAILQELQLPVLKNSECKERYRDQRKLISEKQFDDGVLCAGYLEGGKDSCQGDSGGPLMVPVRSGPVFLYYQIGVVSYGIGCARVTTPGVYTQSGPPHLLTPEEGCGFSNITHRRIVGGSPAKLGAWPWMTLMGYKDNLGDIEFKCGGSIITQKHILSAAHCVEPALAQVRVGEHDLDTDTETQHLDVPVDRAIAHPEYDKEDGHSDIAIVLLKELIPFSLRINAVCIPTEPPVLTRDFEGSQPFVAGWGHTKEGGKSAAVLQELQLPVLNNNECKERYKVVKKLVSEKQFDDGVFCAGKLEGGKDSCQGDSGGPLMMPILSGRAFLYYQIGIISYGIGCARAATPGVYTRIPTYSKWIQEQIASNP
ncbi:transmembrane protease serine 9-like [Phlebotomus argentipes]|uniref:transmembrane protease serine 9-like n=1 Tax=Phlebotomus argentipes TaxID=94469 RepID=UPI002892D10A|nr:transmembrane protease serine 9-like [Phlebotomus argentipes]